MRNGEQISSINKLAYLSFFSKADTFFAARSQLAFSAVSIQNSALPVRIVNFKLENISTRTIKRLVKIVEVKETFLQQT
jgi:hypothetical protein